LNTARPTLRGAKFGGGGQVGFCSRDTASFLYQQGG